VAPPDRAPSTPVTTLVRASDLGLVVAGGTRRCRGRRASSPASAEARHAVSARGHRCSDVAPRCSAFATVQSATSARRSRAGTPRLAPLSSKSASATPTLPRRRSRTPPTSIASASAARTRAAMASGVGVLSDARRDDGELVRAEAGHELDRVAEPRSRCATSRRTRSPRACPRVSLISLKRSMSEHEHRTLDSAHLRLLGCCDRVACSASTGGWAGGRSAVVQRLVPDRALGPTARGRGKPGRSRTALTKFTSSFGELAWAPAPDRRAHRRASPGPGSGTSITLMASERVPKVRDSRKRPRGPDHHRPPFAG